MRERERDCILHKSWDIHRVESQTLQTRKSDHLAPEIGRSMYMAAMRGSSKPVSNLLQTTSSSAVSRRDDGPFKPLSVSRPPSGKATSPLKAP